jgi:hypothetical protein
MSSQSLDFFGYVDSFLVKQTRPVSVEDILRGSLEIYLEQLERKGSLVCERFKRKKDQIWEDGWRTTDSMKEEILGINGIIAGSETVTEWPSGYTGPRESTSARGGSKSESELVATFAGCSPGCTGPHESTFVRGEPESGSESGSKSGSESELVTTFTEWSSGCSGPSQLISDHAKSSTIDPHGSTIIKRSTGLKGSTDM